MNDYQDVGHLENYITMPIAENNGSATIGNFALVYREVKSADINP